MAYALVDDERVRLDTHDWVLYDADYHKKGAVKVSLGWESYRCVDGRKLTVLHGLCHIVEPDDNGCTWDRVHTSKLCAINSAKRELIKDPRYLTNDCG